jgi:hypothetical protein
MQHTVYITTNLADNRFYIGKHSRVAPDSYKGSGKWIYDCEKSGAALKCDLVAICQTEDDAYKFERTLITAAKKQYGKLCMNFNDGGKGNSTANELNKELRQKISKTLKGRKLQTEHKEKVVKAIRERVSANKQLYVTNINEARKLRKFGPESREKMRQAKLGKKQSVEQIEKRRQSLINFYATRKNHGPHKIK